MGERMHFLYGTVALLIFASVSSGDRGCQIAQLADVARTTENAKKPQTPDYHFESASFTKEFWIDNKRVFKKPGGVDVEFVTAGAFDWVFADANGKEVRTLHHKNEHGGWTSMNFASLGLYADYSIGFRNASAGEQQIKQGDVHLK
jgi:hypothetical protein